MPVKARPGHDKEMRTWPRRTRGVEPPVPSKEGRNGQDESCVRHPTQIPPRTRTIRRNIRTDGMPGTRQMTRTSQTTTNQENQNGRTRSLSRRGQKRTNTGNVVSSRDKENQQTGDTNNQRPQRTIIPSRRALEATESNTRLIQWHDQQMDIDENTEP